MPAAGLHHSVVQVGPGLAIHQEPAAETALHAGKRMVDKDELPRHLESSFGYRGATGRRQDGLHIGERRRGDGAKVEHTVQHLANQVKR